MKHQEPQEMINMHIQMQKKDDPLFLFNDPGMKGKLAKLQSNFGQDVPVGSIMVDKSKIVTIYTDTKLDSSLLNVLMKRRQMNTSDDDSMIGVDTIINEFV